MFDLNEKERIFSRLYLKAGFPQIIVKPKDVRKRTFNTKYGQFEYLSVPMETF